MRIGIALPVGLAFIAGLALSPVAQQLLPSARAQAAAAPGLAPLVIDVAALKDADLGATPFDLRSKMFVNTPNATISVQTGNIAKHIHEHSDEIQYIVEGTGTAWLGGQKIDLHPGLLIVIPRGTPHAGTVATSGRFKALAIKIPPQEPKDTTFVD